MGRSVFVCILYFLSATFYGQLRKEAWHWQFGLHCALDFSSGIPMIDSCALQVTEGSASISDPNTGQLLFYSDGDSVWNRNDQLMPHGFGLLGGEGTSTQAALIIPKPGDPSIYYLFTADQGGYFGVNHGVHYSVINMNMAGGLGDVATKNIVLTAAPATEKLVGVRHCNGNDYWIITHPLNSNSFNAYAVTSNGVNPVPVTSSVGTVHLGSASNHNYTTIGYMKASPNGKKLALGITVDIPIAEIFDFDPSSGKVSNPVTIKYNYPDSLGAYGLSFSPDNSKLYVGAAYPEYTGDIWQYDLSNPDSAVIVGSQTYIGACYDGALQLAPDGKIYVTSYFGTTLFVIDDPNASGTACNYHPSNLTFPYPRFLQIGLPNFVDAVNTEMPFEVRNLIKCSSSFSDTIKAGLGYSSYTWSTGATSPTIVVTDPGTYWITVTSNGCSATDTFKVATVDTSKIDLLKDTTICSTIGYYPADAFYDGAIGYQWYNGSHSPAIDICSSGTYSTIISFLGGCSVRDSFNLVLNKKPQVYLGNDTIFCSGMNQSMPLNAGSGVPGYTFNWSTGANTPTIVANNPGSYLVTVSSANDCSTSDTINIYAVPPQKLLSDVIVCNKDDLPITLKLNYYGPSTTDTLSSGIFWYLNGNVVHNGAHDSTFMVSKPGTYGVAVQLLIPPAAAVCVLTDSAVVGFGMDPKYVEFPFPNIVTPNDDGINERIDFSTYRLAALSFIVYDRWGKVIFETSDPEDAWAPHHDDGTYYFVCTYTVDCGGTTGTRTRKGFITITR